MKNLSLPKPQKVYEKSSGRYWVGSTQLKVRDIRTITLL